MGVAGRKAVWAVMGPVQRLTAAVFAAWDADEHFMSRGSLPGLEVRLACTCCLLRSPMLAVLAAAIVGQLASSSSSSSSSSSNGVEHSPFVHGLPPCPAYS